MKILYITSLFNLSSSSASIRNLGYINALSEEIGKENVDVLTVKWPENMYDKNLVSETKCNEIIYCNVSIIDKYFNNGNKEKVESALKDFKFLREIKSMLREFIYFPGVDKEWINKVGNIDTSDYDMIISSSDTKVSHFVGEKLKLRNDRLKWIQIWGDPWSIDITLKKLTQIRAKKYEEKLLDEADYVFYVSEPTQKKIIEKYPSLEDKIKYIPRGYSMRVPKAESTQTDNIRLLYTGLLNKDRNIRPILEALDEYNCNKEKSYRISICGNIDNESLEILNNHDSADYKGVKSYFEIIDEYKKGNILVYIDNKGNGTQIPGKLYDYFGTYNMILALVEDLESETSKFIKATGRSLVVLNQKEEILKVLDKIEEIKKNAYEPLEQFSCIEAIKKVLSII